MERNNMYKNGIPQLDGKKYAFWRRRMKTYIETVNVIIGLGE
jgi:hypothetical protein